MKKGKWRLNRLKNIHKSVLQKKYWVLTSFVLLLLIVLSGGFGIAHIVSNKSNGAHFEDGYCGDGTLDNSCSQVKPYFCFEGKFIESASECGCPEGFFKKGESCSHEHFNSLKRIKLKYILNGELNYIYFDVYEDASNYISKLPRHLRYSENSTLSRADFKLMVINNEYQRELLLPLVIKIQNITSDKEDQARIAISLVQNIPFGMSNKTDYFLEKQVNYSRYPYEVLYDFQGVCGEKTDLLTFLLREIGYGISFFYYIPENHEVAGIKCPIEKSLMGTGYCFVETTYPAILTDNEVVYSGIGKLYSTPEFYYLEDGDSLGKNLREYKDAKKFKSIKNSISKRGKIGPFYKKVIDDLTYRYGLIEKYF